MEFENNTGFDKDCVDVGWDDDQSMDDSAPNDESGTTNNAGANGTPGPRGGGESKGNMGKGEKFRNKKKRTRNQFGYGRGGGGGGRGGGYGGYGGYGGPPPRFFGPPSLMGPPGYFSPPGPPGPFVWGRGFGPSGPPVRKTTDNKALRYLQRCGVAKEHLRNLPRDFLQLIEPQYCGLCGHNFDSFNTSRLHYISKNHLRSQRKWLAQQSDGGFRRAREIPLKSRELYCELCDVHITSKTHADSHYAGKNHRAVVEGRKNPKNPILLQRGMQDRVDQLIRREKKHLKSVVEENEEGEQDFFKEIKTTSPDLYCDICKTSVTCTEQMTMHLNGKRHLAKEKQHILKMMKGGTDAASGEAEPAEVVEKAADDDAEEEDTEDKDEEAKPEAEEDKNENPETSEAQEEEWAGQW